MIDHSWILLKLDSFGYFSHVVDKFTQPIFFHLISIYQFQKKNLNQFNLLILFSDNVMHFAFKHLIPLFFFLQKLNFPPTSIFSQNEYFHFIRHASMYAFNSFLVVFSVNSPHLVHFHIIECTLLRRISFNFLYLSKIKLYMHIDFLTKTNISTLFHHPSICIFNPFLSVLFHLLLTSYHIFSKLGSNHTIPFIKSNLTSS